MFILSSKICINLAKPTLKTSNIMNDDRRFNAACKISLSLFWKMADFYDYFNLIYILLLINMTVRKLHKSVRMRFAFRLSVMF